MRPPGVLPRPPSPGGRRTTPSPAELLGTGLGFAALSLLAQGLRWGVADHLLHLPLAADATGDLLPPGDLLAGAAAAHPTLWWPILASLGITGGLLLHLGVLVATGAALLRLARVLVGPAAPWVPLLLAVGQVALGGVDTADSLLLPRGVALPLELWAWAWFAEGRPRRAFALLGVCLCLHAPSAAAITAALALLHLRADRSLLPLLLFPLFAAPVLGPWLMSGTAPLRLDPEHAAVIALRLGHHVDASTWPVAAWRDPLAWLGIVALGWRRAGAQLRGATLGLLLVAAVGALGWSLRLALPVQLELWQAGRFLTILGAMAAASLLVDGRRSLREVAAGLLAVGQVLPGGVLLALARQRGAPRAPHPLLWATMAAAMLWAAGHPPAGRSRARWAPNPPTWPLQAAVEGLSPDALVATPPVGFEGLRRGGVGLYGTWKDGGEGLFDADRAREWRRRMGVLAGVDALAPIGRVPGRGGRQRLLRQRLQEGFQTQDVAVLAHRLRGEGVRYLIWAGPGPAGAAVIAVEGDHALLDLAQAARPTTIDP